MAQKQIGGLKKGDRNPLDGTIMTGNPFLDDFRNFLAFVWKHLGLPMPTPMQFEIAYWLQCGPKRQIIQAFRGCGKSWITAAFVIWRLMRNPQLQFLVVSASKGRSDAFTIFTLRLIKEIKMCQFLTPQTHQRESMVEFDVGPAKAAQSASVRAVGIKGQITGGRAHHIIADDVEVPTNSATQDMREKLLKDVSEFNAIVIPEGNPRITFLGTPQSEESIYKKLMGKKYVTRIWPSRYPRPEKIAGYMGCLAPSITANLEKNLKLAGTAVDPSRFNDFELADREASYGRSGFALQFQLDTSLSDAERYPLKTGDLIISNLGKEKGPISIQYGSGPQQHAKDIPNVGFSGDKWFRPMYSDERYAPYEGIVLAIDPAGRGKDQTTYCVLAQLHGNLFLLAMGGFDGGYEDSTLETLAVIAKEYKVKHCIIESNFGDGMFTKLLQPHMRRIHGVCKLEEIRHSQQKERRVIDTLEPVMNQHRLIIDESIIRKDLSTYVTVERMLHYSLFYQMTRITVDRNSLKHDDMIDVLAIAVAYWTDSMSRDVQTAMKAQQAKAMDEEIKNHIKNIVGFNQYNGPESQSWGL